VFENSDVAINDIDFSHLYETLQSLKGAGVSDLDAWFDAKPDRLEDICRRITLNNMNRAGLELFGAESLAQLRSIDYFPAERAPRADPRDRACDMERSADVAPRGAVLDLHRPGHLDHLFVAPADVRDGGQARAGGDARRIRRALGRKRQTRQHRQVPVPRQHEHEIRTPLNGVIGNLELLAQTDLGEDQEDLLFDAEKRRSRCSP